ncbi:hypothetical protein E308F_22610 [Moorella sp. E308F]|uniref:tripartite tricarboxylate transporter TctB family protein n=1 Tax=Moorella sp. E308F TaxID=2572682 RepID=UPI0010FFBA12|nr:tripartite tricarboxylate transporter TctB family protein [Moorella sp. E308F]GEA16017.1 hypothetical protein E308F_22610 [Moorella sp. E308F]
MIEIAMAIFFVILSVSYTVFARQYSFGTFYAPRAGFMPTIVGTMATILAMINLFGTAAQYRRKQTQEKEILLTRYQINKIFLYSIGLVIYVVLLKTVGFLTATFLATLYLIKVAGGKGWRLPIIVAIGVSVGFYSIFQYLLRVILP